MSDLIDLVGDLSQAQAWSMVRAHGVATCRHLLALTLDHARENRAGYLRACARSGTRIPYAPEEIERTIRRARDIKTGFCGYTPPVPKTRFLAPTDPWAHLWAPALADLRAMNRGIADALAGSRLAGIDDRGLAVVRVRDGHTAANERLRRVVARTLAAVAQGKGVELQGVVMEGVEG